MINPSPQDDPQRSWSLVDEISQKQLADDEWHQVAITFDSGYGRYSIVIFCLVTGYHSYYKTF